MTWTAPRGNVIIPCQRGVLFIEYGSWFITQLRTQVLFDHDKALWSPQRISAQAQEFGEVCIAHVSEAPLAPQNVKARRRVIFAGNEADTPHYLCVVHGIRWIEFLKRCLDECYALASISDSWPSDGVPVIVVRPSELRRVFALL